MNEMRIKKIANIHPTKDFDPADFVVSGEHGPFLPVTDKKLWFRAKFPDGVIKKEIEEVNKEFARVHVRLYTSRDEGEDKFIAEGYAQRFFKEEPYKENFLEEAFRAATRAALTDAGFSCGYAESEYGEGAGAPYVVEPQESQQSVPVPAFSVMPTNQTTSQYPNRSPQTVISAATGIPLGKEQRKAVIPMQNANPVSQPKPLTLDEALNMKTKISKWAGYSLARILQESSDPENLLKWLVNDYNGPDKQIKAAAAVVLENMEKQKNQAA